MPASAQRQTRAYLPATERRLHLLDAGARIVAAKGWEGLSMQGVAQAAGVSRQLVYEHFASLPELHTALLQHLFEPAYLATEAVARSTRDAVGLLRQAYEMLLDLPAEQRHLLAALIGDERPSGSDLGRARRLLRKKILALWVPYVVRETGVDESEAGALAWMVIVAGFGLADLVRTREIGRDAAAEIFVRVAAGAIAATRAEQAARR